MDKAEVYRILRQAYFSDSPDEKDALPAVARLLHGVKLFVDVGASLGQFTKLASECMRDGEIIAVEADPIRFEELERNCRKWAEDSGNRIYAIHAAVTDTSGTVRFQTTNSNKSGGLMRLSTATEGRAVEWSEIEVKAVTMDELCGTRPPDLVKMDIEGGELLALGGGRNCLKSKQSRLLVEVHTFPELGGHENARSVVKLMRSMGYGYLPFYGKYLFAARGAFSVRERVSLRWRWAFAGLRRRLRM